jgi:hypothetical protein
MLIGAEVTRVAEVRWACSMCKQSAGEVKLYSAANGSAIVRNSFTSRFEGRAARRRGAGNCSPAQRGCGGGGFRHAFG